MIYLLVFLSGLAGLIYQVLWMKQLSLLFGSTSQAAAVTLSAFFGGLAAGSWFWGKRSAKSSNSVRIYACLQAGIAVTALFYFVVLQFYHHIYPPVYQNIDSPAVLLLIKFALAILLIFPPTFCMGGTIPVIGQYLIRTRSAFGTKSAMLYGINTFGAAAGAILAGFFLPVWLGYRMTCFGAIAVNILIAVFAFWMSRKPLADTSLGLAIESNRSTNQKRISKSRKRGIKPELKPQHEPEQITARWIAFMVCFVSGFGVLALEVLWTRMFAQVLENSVYTFAAILVIVLVCLSAGALISSRLAKLNIPPHYILTALIIIGAAAVSLTPLIFMSVTNSFQVIATRGSWASYVMLVFRKGFLAIGPAAFLLGTIFPFIMKIEEHHSVSPGKSLGRLAAVNTAGSILGSLICGFILLETLGMWRTMQLIALIYFCIALIIPMKWNGKGLALKIAGGFCIILLFTVLSPAKLPVSGIAKASFSGKIIETWQTKDCTVSVTEEKDIYGRANRSIMMNSNYSLGSTAATLQQKLQADVPLMAYPKTESIFFLGMGTGVTAGSALDSKFEHVNRIITCELVPEVITAAKKYLTDFNGYDHTAGLFSDPRATVLAEDGRHFLMATGEKFDMINSDLFVPFRSGVGNLYSKEHFEKSQQRLNPGGVFFQWLPLYQLTEKELHIIAKTMLEVFDQVTLWRNNFQPGEEVIAIAGHKDASPLPACDIDSSKDKLIAVQGKTHRDLEGLFLPFDPQTILFFYCGNLTEAKELFEDYPVNSDNRPLIEYMAPRSFREETGNALPWFVGPRLAKLVEEIQRICPPDKDPILVNRSAENRRLPAAGAAFHRARIWEIIGDEEKCRQAWQRFTKEWINQ